MEDRPPPATAIAEAAEYLPKVPRASVYKLAQRGRIPCQKVGRHWRFRRTALEECLWGQAQWSGLPKQAESK